MSRQCLQLLPSTVASLAITLAACGPAPIRVVGVMRESSEMRPLPSVPPGAYKQLRVLVRPAADQPAAKYGSADCGVTPLEGSSTSEERNNAACVPADTLNDAVRLVRQRMRSYGVDLVKDGSEPYDYKVEVLVTGLAPRKAEPMMAKAFAKLTFTLQTDANKNTLMNGIDQKAAGGAFAAVAKDCVLRDADLSSFSTVSTQPMTPDFDVVALAADAVDNALGCAEVARFFLDAAARFPKSAPPPPPASASPATAPSAIPAPKP